MATKITQGDSYWKDFSSKKVPTFDASWAGTWGIVDSTGAVVATGVMAKSTDSTKLELRVNPEDTEPLTPKDYTLVVKIFNPNIKYKKEVSRESITIVKQSLVV